MPPFSDLLHSSQEQPIKTAPLSGKWQHNILVIDDDPSILKTIQEILKLEGYTVAAALNGAEGLERVRQQRPSLILLDMRMPIMDGWGFARRLKEHGFEIPILVMTAAQDARTWAEEIGAQGCIDKPFDVLQLLEAVEGMLG